MTDRSWQHMRRVVGACAVVGSAALGYAGGMEIGGGHPGGFFPTAVACLLFMGGSSVIRDATRRLRSDRQSQLQ